MVILGMIVMANTHEFNRYTMAQFAAMLNKAHEDSVNFECTCATNIGMYMCSDTSVSTDAMCKISFCTYSGTNEATATNMGIYLYHLYGILNGMFVNLYHVSACKFGFQNIALFFGPNAIHLPTSHDHIDAERTNRTLIYVCLDYI